MSQLCLHACCRNKAIFLLQCWRGRRVESCQHTPAAISAVPQPLQGGPSSTPLVHWLAVGHLRVLHAASVNPVPGTQHCSCSVQVHLW